MGLRLKQVLSQSEIDELQALAVETHDYNAAVRYSAQRMHSQREVEQYLKRKGVEPEASSQIIDRLIESGLINDLEFARMWVRDRVSLKLRSLRRLEQELQAKGVSRDVIDQVVGEQEEAGQSAALGELIAKKRRSGVEDDQKLIQYLLRQGFSFSDIKQALEDENR